MKAVQVAAHCAPIVGVHIRSDVRKDLKHKTFRLPWLAATLYAMCKASLEPMAGTRAASVR